MSTVELTPIKVGDTTISSEAFAAALRQRDLKAYQATVDRVVDYHLVRNACQRQNITATDAELQEEADGFRRAHGLTSAEQTNAWLEHKNLSVYDLERYAEYRILVRKLLETNFGPDYARDYLSKHIHRYTVAALSVIVVGAQQKADTLAEQLREDPAQFARLAREHSVEPKTAPAGGMLGWKTLLEIPEPVRDAVFNSAGAGEILGPIQSGDTWHLIQVAAVEKPAFGPQIENVLVNDLLRDWIAAERQRVTIEYGSPS